MYQFYLLYDIIISFIKLKFVGAFLCFFFLFFSKYVERDMYMKKKRRGQKLRSRLSGRRGCDLDTDKRLSDPGSNPNAAAALQHTVLIF